MFIEVYGLGPIGVLNLLHLASKGFKVNGRDKDLSKVERLGNPEAFYDEPKIRDLIIENGAKLFSEATQKENKSVYLICVGTPSREDGAVELGYVENCIDEICSHHQATARAVFILRSTVPPGTCEKLIERIGENLNTEFDFIFFPEFIRTGQSWEDLANPSVFIYASSDGADLEVLESFPGFELSQRVSFKTAEYTKYVSNSWHAVKVAFANELASVGRAYGVDVDETFDIFLSDNKLNLGAKYLRPGAPFGGPCLHKEVMATSMLAQRAGVDTPLVNSVNPSNECRVEEVVKSIKKDKFETIYLIGSGFRPGTQDERNSIPLKVYQRILEKNQGARGEILQRLPGRIGKDDLVIIGSCYIDDGQREDLVKSGCEVLDLGLSRIHRGASR